MGTGLGFPLAGPLGGTQTSPLGNPAAKANQVLTYPDNVDFSTFIDPSGVPDLDPNWTSISGTRSRLEQIMRRWVSVTGEFENGLIGANLWTIINQATDKMQLDALASRLKSQAKMVEDVDDCSVTVARTEQTKVKIQGIATLGNGQDIQFVFELTPDKIALITLLGPST